MHERGVVSSEPGLYFVGLIGQYSLSSEAIPGTGRDPGYVAEAVASRASTDGATATRSTAAA